MRNNGAPSGRENKLRDNQILVSRADLDGRVVYANADFIEISGYAEAELLGQPHNIVRHPEMPELVFADLWADISAGRPWVGVIKNRCKNGDSYWVEAHVSPIREMGVITGYLSMRRKPSAAQIAKVESTYAAIRENRASGFVFQHGAARATGALARLRTAFVNSPIAFKLVLSSLLVALVVLSCLAFFLAKNVSEVLDQDARERLKHDVGLVHTAVIARIESSRSEAVDHGRTLSERLYWALGDKKIVNRAAIEALAQNARTDQRNPIERFLPDLRTVATVFVRTPQGFQRVMSNLKNESGGSVLGTWLESSHPALNPLLAGNSYTGSARLFGRAYMTNYTPIVNINNEVVGATFVGIDLAKSMSLLNEKIRGLKVGSTGYYYIIDVTPGSGFGNVILHPYRQGQQIPALISSDGKDVFPEMIRQEQGELIYPWLNVEAGETSARQKLVRFETLHDPHWIVAGGSALDEFTALSTHLAWFLVASGLAMAAAIFFILLWLLRRLILQPLNRQVLPAFHAISAGNFATKLKIYGNDEIAQVMQGLECLQNRLAFDSEQTHALSAAREASLKEAEALSRTRAEFLANMSHEIRTPMNAVIGLAYLLQKGQLGSRERDYVSRIEGAGKLLLGLVNDILDFSKIDAGKLHLEEAPFYLDDILENLSMIVHDRVREKSLVLEYVVAPDVPQALSGDQLRLSQILINLVGNAIKFTAQGDVTLFISVGKRDERQVQLEFRIQDTGIGMSPEQAAKLFKAFAQADSSVTRKFGGTGLGLAICKHLVELMDGSIRVDSQPNGGSIFSFDVRLGINNIELAPAHRVPYRVLVVDDNDLARTVLARLLQKNGCIVQTRDSGDAALSELQDSTATPFDFVLLDLNMPGMNGLMLAQHIRANYGLRMKLILVTSMNINDEVYCEALGNFDFVLEKPVTAAKIAETLAHFSRPEGDGKLAEATSAPELTSLAGLRILVAEDVPTNQLIMRDLLESLGATVDIADNGLLALALLASQGEHIDLILMDIQMPEMDGLEATRRIRAGQVRADIPIIALTANALDEEHQRCTTAGMNDFLTKPIEPSQLIAVLQHWRPQPRDSAAKPTIRAQTPGIVNFPDLPGIDIDEGLQRMLNRAPLYEKVLRDFYARFLGETDRILAALAANETEEAIRRAHSLKGISGTIAAKILARLAFDLEEAIKTSSPELDEALENADMELIRVLEGIQQGFAIDQNR